MSETRLPEFIEEFGEVADKHRWGIVDGQIRTSIVVGDKNFLCCPLDVLCFHQTQGKLETPVDDLGYDDYVKILGFSEDDVDYIISAADGTSITSECLRDQLLTITHLDEE